MINRRALFSIGAASVPAGLATLGFSRVAEAFVGPALTRRHVIQWTRRYGRAWVRKDADAAVQLFTEDAVYQAIPGISDQTFVGRAEIHDYWVNVTAAQSNVTVRHGEPLIQGNRATIELWVTMQIDGINPAQDDWVTLIEANLLTFADTEHCRVNVEYWNLQMGVVAPPPGWGTGE